MKPLALLLLLPSALAAAQGSLCEKTASTPLDREACGEQRWQASDQMLNQVYKQIMANLNEPQKNLLRQAQRAWLAFRDGNCASQASYANRGAMDTATLKHCLATTTDARAQELRAAYLDSEKTMNISEEALLGSWQSLESGYGVVITFRIQNGLRHFVSTLNGLAFEAGQWQLNQGVLTISAADGHPLHIYQHIAIDQNQLSLKEQDGGLERYQRVPDSTSQ